MHKLFRHGVFPESGNRNVFVYYALNIVFNIWFTEAVWYFYWGRFASYSTIGLIFSISAFTQLFITIPAGVFADMFGRRKSVILGAGLLFTGNTLIALGPTVWVLFAGVILQGVGRSFITGALDALVFDSLKKEGKSERYSNVVAFNTQLTLIAFASTASLGGVLYAIHFRLAHILSALAALTAFIVSWFLMDIGERVVHTDHLKTFIQHHKQGFKELLLPQMRVFVVPALVIAVLMRMYDWGISKPTIAVGFGFFTKEQSILYAVLAILCAIIVGQMGWFQKRMDDMRGILMIGVAVCAGFIASYFSLHWWGAFVMLGIESAGRLSYAWMPAIVNKRIGSTYRATTLSTLDFIGRVPYIGLNYLAGVAIDHKLITSFHATLGAVGLLLIFIWYSSAKKRAAHFV